MARQINPVLNASVSRRSAFGAVCLWCFLFSFYAAPTSLTQYRFDSWTTDNGLPHNKIRALWQTRDGYLWLTTAAGVARFDGVRFRVFDKGNTPAITTNNFAYDALWEDRQSNLWMGTLDRGVIRYREGHFTALTTDDGLPSNNITRIDEDEDGTIWVFTEGGLAQWKDGRLVRVAPAPGSPFNDCLEDPRKYFGVDGRRHGLWRMNSS
ncbi:MAG TPA: two-component regulator propeller domain-containing protein, partial [Pyrinomonadaceae bacterium]|nr:two-component regulator propeller domain-containing protein [Pyrinomonadaceae bacterium]